MQHAKLCTCEVSRELARSAWIAGSSKRTSRASPISSDCINSRYPCPRRYKFHIHDAGHRISQQSRDYRHGVPAKRSCNVFLSPNLHAVAPHVISFLFITFSHAHPSDGACLRRTALARRYHVQRDFSTGWDSEAGTWRVLKLFDV